jgi:ABC-type dipeptide/oligopeptide/nickel transport system permease component
MYAFMIVVIAIIAVLTLGLLVGIALALADPRLRLSSRGIRHR